MRWLSCIRVMRPTRAQQELDLDQEIRTHLELEAEERQELGMARDEARYAVQRAFGNRTIVSEEIGVRPALGRLLTHEDDRPGNSLAVISHAYWQRCFSRFAVPPPRTGAWPSRQPVAMCLPSRHCRRDPP